MICIAGCRPVVPFEGTTLGARHCSGRHGGLPLQLDVRRAQPTFDLRSSLLTLGKADASIALLSLNRRLHFSFFTSRWRGQRSAWIFLRSVRTLRPFRRS